MTFWTRESVLPFFVIKIKYFLFHNITLRVNFFTLRTLQLQRLLFIIFSKYCVGSRSGKIRTFPIGFNIMIRIRRVPESEKMTVSDGFWIRQNDRIRRFLDPTKLQYPTVSGSDKMTVSDRIRQKYMYTYNRIWVQQNGKFLTGSGKIIQQAKLY